MSKLCPRDCPNANCEHISKPTDIDEDVIGFLLGRNALDGYWYGERPKDRPTFWWRKRLQAYIAIQQDKLIEQIQTEVIGEDLSVGNIDPLTSPKSYNARLSQNQLKAKQRIALNKFKARKAKE